MSAKITKNGSKHDTPITMSAEAIELESKPNSESEDEPHSSPDTEHAVRLALRFFYLYHYPPRPDFSEWREDCEQIAWLTALEAENAYSSQFEQLKEDSNIHRLFYLHSKILVALKREWRQERRWRQRVSCSTECDKSEMEFSDPHADEEISKVEDYIGVERFLKELKNRLEEPDWFILQQLANGNTQNEIANFLGITQSAVCQRLMKIRSLAMEIATKLGDL